MTSISEIQYLGQFVHFISGYTGSVTSYSKQFLNSALPDEDGPAFPSDEIPLQDGDEINLNRDIPEEEEYLPDEEEVPVQEPLKEIEDPYFPEKSDGLPPIKEDEFPKTDPD
ncbi:hypothetical protein SYJ56_03225 [Algoriphagus sp. D3-2-R+10]|uniref:hypothetical protein n=1 Tax=Algoriphagus aurantiacus TaxID=3103948 RepID=UPI002B3D1F1C|nr:hypothetical protein [Algoriphagus sp. D3-2-R+10]MEB2774299.1 hypothetical protein [Algoriphagus sp. D3-2-R+10]